MKALTIFLTSGLVAFSASAQVGVSGGDGVRGLALIESSVSGQAEKTALESAVSAQAEKIKVLRGDIDKDIALAEAVRRANEQFPSSQPLTEDEVVAAVRAIKMMQPDIKEDTYEQYMRVAKERVLPKGMYFNRITAWNTQDELFQVDWVDLCIAGRVATAEEKAEVMSKLFGNDTSAAKESKSSKNDTSTRKEFGGAYGYRIRTRFISSTQQTRTR